MSRDRIGILMFGAAVIIGWVGILFVVVPVGVWLLWNVLAVLTGAA